MRGSGAKLSDLRGLSRGSKTAAAVIVGVLLQVIVVAVLGLTAITRERRARPSDMRSSARMIGLLQSGTGAGSGR